MQRVAALASAGLCLSGAVIWSIPMLAAGLLALLRYGFGSLFVVGESVASVLLGSTGADIAGTLDRLHAAPLRSAAGAALGVVSSAGAASLGVRAPLLACGLALAASAWAWRYGMPVAAAVLLPASGFALLAAVPWGSDAFVAKPRREGRRTPKQDTGP